MRQAKNLIQLVSIMVFTRCSFTYCAHYLLLDAVIIFIFRFNLFYEILWLFCIPAVAITTVCHKLRVDISSIELLLICLFHFLPVSGQPLSFFIPIVTHGCKLCVDVLHSQVVDDPLRPCLRTDWSL
jgi:hypothetical protein